MQLDADLLVRLWQMIPEHLQPEARDPYILGTLSHLLAHLETRGVMLDPVAWEAICTWTIINARHTVDQLTTARNAVEYVHALLLAK